MFSPIDNPQRWLYNINKEQVFTNASIEKHDQRQHFEQR